MYLWCERERVRRGSGVKVYVVLVGVARVRRMCVNVSAVRVG